MASIIITGASKGIGRATAIELAGRGHRVVATARDPRSLDDLDVALRLPLDVTDPASVVAAVESAGEIDVLVSNAGTIFYSAVESTPIDELRDLFDRNTFGALRVVQAVLPQMRARRSGKVLFVSSIIGRITLPGSSAYASTKWAMEAIGETLAQEVGPFGISVGLLEPGAVASGALDDVVRYDLPRDPYSSIFERRRDSAGSMITPQDVATAIADAAESEALPLRIPIGDPARQILAARRQAPDDVPFIPGGAS